MISNRSMPSARVIPVLAYPDVQTAAKWLCDAFGFTIRISIGNHRVQLNTGAGGALVVNELVPGDACNQGHSIMIRVEDVDSHHARAMQHGARILKPPTSFPYGERQYNLEDPAGHRWTFSQSIADVDPAEWGGEAGRL